MSKRAKTELGPTTSDTNAKPALALSTDLLCLFVNALDEQRGRTQIHEVALLSRAWAEAVGIAPLELRKLKRASVALDLAFLRKDFVKAAEKGLGFLLSNWPDHAETMTAFTIAVEGAYKKFLVVKAVETKARIRSEASSVFWHAHMLNPQHYSASCTALLGAPGLIDHTPGYKSPEVAPGSDFVAKAYVLTKDKQAWLAMAFDNKHYDVYGYGYSDHDCG
ncbi:hypothetical protein T492DRAFT_917446 [Pavlovales sp. CCMP2436]|nr:hypothetical protein T492DRAFT_917446 [Pavlovales sp. CCMP2436]